MHGHDVWSSEALHIFKETRKLAIVHKHRIMLEAGRKEFYSC